MKLKVITNDSDVSETEELPCDSCHTNCCKEYVIFVNAHDTYRLSVGLGLNPESFLEIYGAKDYDLGITEKTKRYATKVLKIAQETKESAGKDPMGLAATALYLACVKNNENMTQRDIAEAANVTEVTIRNRIKGLKNLHNS